MDEWCSPGLTRAVGRDKNREVGCRSNRSSPHRVSRRLTAWLPRLPLKGGVIKRSDKKKKPATLFGNSHLRPLDPAFEHGLSCTVAEAKARLSEILLIVVENRREWRARHLYKFRNIWHSSTQEEEPCRSTMSAIASGGFLD